MTASLATYQNAVKKIEQGGINGFWGSAKLAGFPVAVSLLIAHLRQGFGSTFPQGTEAYIDTIVEDYLQEHLPQVMHYMREPHGCFYMSEHYALDNFSAFSVTYKGRTGATLEHLYQAAKFDDENVIRRILALPSAHEAKKIANSDRFKHLKHRDWDEVKVRIMKELLRAKAEQHKYVMKTLLRTKGLILIEDSPVDSFWGRGGDWAGANNLGRLWVELREEFLAEQK